MTLAIRRVGKSKAMDKTKPKKRAGPRWKGVKGITVHRYAC